MMQDIIYFLIFPLLLGIAFGYLVGITVRKFKGKRNG